MKSRLIALERVKASRGHLDSIDDQEKKILFLLEDRLCCACKPEAT